MRRVHFLPLVLCFIYLSACNSSRVVGPPVHSARSDYVSGGVYILNKPAFLFKHNKADPKETPVLAPLGFSGTPTSLADFQVFAPNGSQVAGLLLPGVTLRVVKFVEHKFFNVGEFLEVLAVVESGPHKGTVLELSMISKKPRPSHDLFVDSEYLTRSDTP
jgi:hypothetical protein